MKQQEVKQILFDALMKTETNPFKAGIIVEDFFRCLTILNAYKEKQKGGLENEEGKYSNSN